MRPLHAKPETDTMLAMPRARASRAHAVRTQLTARTPPPLRPCRCPAADSCPPSPASTYHFCSPFGSKSGSNAREALRSGRPVVHALGHSWPARSTTRIVAAMTQQTAILNLGQCLFATGCYELSMPYRRMWVACPRCGRLAISPSQLKIRRTEQLRRDWHLPCFGMQQPATTPSALEHI